jgi:hypothetical protein
MLMGSAALLLLLFTMHYVMPLSAQTSLEPESSAGAFQGVIATAMNSNPQQFPQVGMWLKTRDTAFLTCVFPNVPGLRLDGWIFENAERALSLDSVNLPGDHQIEFRHRFRQQSAVLLVTTVTAEPEAVELIGRIEIDAKRLPPGASADKAIDASLEILHHTINSHQVWIKQRVRGEPDLAPDICFQLMRGPAFQNAPVDSFINLSIAPQVSPLQAENYWEYVKRSFIFTDKGRTFLDQTQRTETAKKHNWSADDPRSSPHPLAQAYFGVWQEVPNSTYCSPTRYVYPVIGVVSKDGKYLVALADSSPRYLYQAWIDCIHDYAQFLPASAPLAQRTWRRKFYAMENDPNALLARVGRDFPGAMKLKDSRIGSAKPQL